MGPIEGGSAGEQRDPVRAARVRTVDRDDESKQRWSLVLLRVDFSRGGRKLQRDDRFRVGHDRIVSGFDRLGVTGNDLFAGTVRHRDLRSSRDHVAGMPYLAGAGAGNRLDIGSPMPPWFESELRDGRTAHAHQICPSVGTCANFVRVMEIDDGNATYTMFSWPHRSPWLMPRNDANGRSRVRSTVTRSGCWEWLHRSAGEVE